LTDPHPGIGQQLPYTAVAQHRLCHKRWLRLVMAGLNEHLELLAVHI
jgi:hypothetical protein